ncbi:50S ribosomal protein L29, chloroplastic-like [Phoenix dactylifera]|uniref:Large ribosomal subunit protein uL29c n=1 Tax=Phoenix dactylifera TaxID=42345 RepID=A0A8B7C3C9_PHODC|nr:50S ribosomal protein L29, chloroplastic-like [Phoenix dactylifera]
MVALGVSSPPFGLISFASSPSSSLRMASSFPSLKSSFHGIRIGSGVRALTPLPSRGGSGGGRMVVSMAKRQEGMKDIRAKTTEELNEEVIDLKGELFLLRLQKSARNEFKSSEFHRMRKRIARMLTVKREREIEEGINKRLSRKIDKQWKKSIVVRPPPSLRKKREEDKAAEAEKST